MNEDCTNIYVGQVLCALNEVRVPPAPGVPIHTLPPATATLANPAAATKPASTKVPEAVITPPPAAAVPMKNTEAAPTKAAGAAPAPAEGEEEEDCEEFEVVEGETDEDLLFCDELF